VSEWVSEQECVTHHAVPHLPTCLGELGPAHAPNAPDPVSSLRSLRRVADCVESKPGVAGQPNTHLPFGRGWPRPEAVLGLILRWRRVLEGALAEAFGRLFST